MGIPEQKKSMGRPHTVIPALGHLSKANHVDGKRSRGGRGEGAGRVNRGRPEGVQSGETSICCDDKGYTTLSICPNTKNEQARVSPGAGCGLRGVTAY